MLSSKEALDDLIEFVFNCEILYPTPLTFQKLEELIQLYHPKGLTIHDVERASIALANNVTKVAPLTGKIFKKLLE